GHCLRRNPLGDTPSTQRFQLGQCSRIVGWARSGTHRRSSQPRPATKPRPGLSSSRTFEAVTTPESIPENNGRAKEALLKLLAYCRANDWAGYDPYDALNSRLFIAAPFLNSRWPRLILTQALKRSPVNLRGLLAVPKTQNPKGLALCLSAVVKLSQ